MPFAERIITPTDVGRKIITKNNQVSSDEDICIKPEDNYER